MTPLDVLKEAKLEKLAQRISQATQVCWDSGNGPFIEVRQNGNFIKQPFHADHTWLISFNVPTSVAAVMEALEFFHIGS